MAFWTKSWKQTKFYVRETLKVLNSKSDKVKCDPKDELPLLVLQEIFSFLSWPDRLKCKGVSKQWKFVIETAGAPPLCLYTREFPGKLKWCFSDRDVLSEDTVYLDPDKFGRLSSKIKLFRGLQKLCLFRVELSQVLKDLHLLRELKVLMIHHCWKKTDENITLNLSCLEKFSLKESHFFQMFDSIDFNTPNLSSLVVWNGAGLSSQAPTELKIKFRFPLQIRHLECVLFDSNLCVLRNLESLICQKIVCPFTLEDFGSLRILELFPRKENELEYIRAIMDEKRRIKRDRLEIIVCGFKDLCVTFQPEDQEDQVHSRSFDLNEHYLREVAEHPDKLVGHIPWEVVCWWSFPAFYRIFREIPENFIKKIVNFNEIRIGDSKRRRKMKCPNSTYVLQLLAQSRPKRVIISYDFDREFYKQLVSIKSIEELNVNARYENLDFDLFLELQNLRSLRVRTEKLPIEFISKIFQLKFMRSFVFSYSKFYIAFALSEENNFYFDLNIDRKKGWLVKLESFGCLEDLIDGTKRLKTENKPFLRGSLL